MDAIVDFLSYFVYGAALALILINLNESRKYLTMKNEILKSKLSVKKSEIEIKEKDV